MHSCHILQCLKIHPDVARNYHSAGAARKSYVDHGIHDLVELMEMEKELLASCGAYCRVCEFYTKKKTPHCQGCASENGHPFWGECQLFACAKKHSVNHCGECPEFPCDLFVNQFDPAEGPKSAFTRAGLLAYRKKAGTHKYVEAVEKLDQSREEKSR